MIKLRLERFGHLCCWIFYDKQQAHEWAKRNRIVGYYLMALVGRQWKAVA